MNNIYIYLNMSLTKQIQIMGPKVQIHREKEELFLTIRYKWEKIIFETRESVQPWVSQEPL